jgi:radical SAM superfamily enzyme YgiQ (UPF0313 family)
LRAPGRILLLSCYEQGHQPLGIAWPAAFLHRAGFAPRLIDLAVSRLDAAAVQEAALVALSVPMHTALTMGVPVARRVRELNPHAHVAFFGLYAHLNREFLLESLADTVLAGESEAALVALAEALDHGGHAAAGKQQAPAEQSPHLRRLSFSVPARAGLPTLRNYAKLLRPRPDGEPAEIAAGHVEATRGCKHLCLHCPIPPVYQGRFFAVPSAVVLADVAQQVAAGAQHITFGDPDFLNGPTHAVRIVQALHARYPALTFDFTAKVEHLLRHRHLLPRFAQAGCAFIVSAVESLSDTVLNNLRKGHTRQDVCDALALLRGVGIPLRPTFVPFTPWSTLPDFLDLLEFVAREGLIGNIDPVQFSIRLLVPPGSGLLDTPQFAPFQGALDREALTYGWTHPDPRLDALQREVARVVERAAAENTPPQATFREIVSAARAAEGINAAPPAWLAEPAPLTFTPRLSEPWFC